MHSLFPFLSHFHTYTFVVSLLLCQSKRQSKACYVLYVAIFVTYFFRQMKQWCELHVAITLCPYVFIDNVTCLQRLPCVQIILQVSVRSMYRLNHKLLWSVFLLFSGKKKQQQKKKKKDFKKVLLRFLRDICLF